MGLPLGQCHAVQVMGHSLCRPCRRATFGQHVRQWPGMVGTHRHTTLLVLAPYNLSRHRPPPNFWNPIADPTAQRDPARNFNYNFDFD